MSDCSKILVEFLGTYIALFSIFYAANKMPKYVPLVVGLSFGILVYMFSDISANFNPAVTLMFVLGKKQPTSDLVYLVLAQILASKLALLTFRFIK